MLALAVGLAIGQRLGWSDERLDAIGAMRQAQMAMDTDLDPEHGSRPAFDLPYTCGGARRLLGRLSRQGQVGEVQTVREWLAATGKSLQPFGHAANEARRRSDENEARNAATRRAASEVSAPKS